MQNEFTSGKPMKLILVFTIPILMGNIMQQFYYLVDSIIIGQYLGVDALAAIGSTGSLSFLVIGWVMGMTSGFSIIIAQRFGANNVKEVKHYIAMSWFLCAIMAVILTIVLLIANRWILTMMNTPPEIFDATYRYIRIIYLGLTATIAYNIFNSTLWALGDSKTPLYFLILSSVVNIALDLLFIAVFSMGVEGAAYATVISQAFASISCLVYMLKKYPILRLKKEDAHFSAVSAKKLLMMGAPMGLQFSITAIGSMVIQVALNGLGPIYIAVFSACGKIQNFIVQPFPSLGSSMASFVGQNTGAGRPDRVKAGVRANIILTLICSIISAVFVLILGDNLTGLFVNDSTGMVAHNARLYFYVSAALYPALGLIYVYRNALQGLGNGIIPMIGGIFELVARVTVAITLTAPFGFLGISISNPVAWFSALIPLIPVYYYQIRKFSRETNL